MLPSGAPAERPREGSWAPLRGEGRPRILRGAPKKEQAAGGRPVGRSRRDRLLCGRPCAPRVTRAEQPSPAVPGLPSSSWPRSGDARAAARSPRWPCMSAWPRSSSQAVQAGGSRAHEPVHLAPGRGSRRRWWVPGSLTPGGGPERRLAGGRSTPLGPGMTYSTGAPPPRSARDEPGGRSGFPIAPPLPRHPANRAPRPHATAPAL